MDRSRCRPVRRGLALPWVLRRVVGVRVVGKVRVQRKPQNCGSGTVHAHRSSQFLFRAPSVQGFNRSRSLGRGRPLAVTGCLVGLAMATCRDPFVARLTGHGPVRDRFTAPGALVGVRVALLAVRFRSGPHRQVFPLMAVRQERGLVDVPGRQRSPVRVRSACAADRLAGTGPGPATEAVRVVVQRVAASVAVGAASCTADPVAVGAFPDRLAEVIRLHRPGEVAASGTARVVRTGAPAVRRVGPDPAVGSQGQIRAGARPARVARCLSHFGPHTVGSSFAGLSSVPMFMDISVASPPMPKSNHTV